MPNTLYDPDHEALVAMLRELRLKKRLHQADLAARLGRSQSFVSNVEGGQRRLDLLELRDWCRAVDADVVSVVRKWTKATGR